MTPRLSEGEVVLRPWRDSDVERVAAVSRDAEILHWTRVPDDNDPERVAAFRAAQLAWTAEGRYAGWIVCQEADDDPLGVLDLRIDAEHARASIGYWLAAGGRGRGVMTRAVRLVTAWALEDRGLARVEILVATGNEASQRVAERAGFVREGVLRSYHELKGRREDLVSFSRLRGEPDRPAG